MSSFVPTSENGRPLSGLFGLADVPTDIYFTRYGGNRYAGQCTLQKNLEPDAVLLAASHGGADVDHPAAGPGRGNACYYGAG